MAGREKAETSVQIDIFRAGDEADILALNRLEYGPTDFMAKPENFRWRYHGNPAEQTIICLARDADTRRIIGYVWIIPVRMRSFGRNERAAILADLIVHPDYRNGVAHAKLIRRRQEILQEKNIAVQYSFPTSEYLKRSRKMEDTASFPVNLVILPFDIGKLAHHYLNRSWKKHLIGWGGRMIQPFLFVKRPVRVNGDKIKIERLEKFDERFDEFWLRVQDKYPVMAVRNKAFLSWRFSPVSDRRYHILAATAAEGIVGYVVSRCTDEIRDIPIGLIADMLLEPGSRGDYAGRLMMAELTKTFRAEKVWLGGGLMLPHASEYKVLRWAGYRPCPKRLAPRVFHLKYRCIGDTSPKTSEIRANDWFVTIADYESY